MELDRNYVSKLGTKKIMVYGNKRQFEILRTVFGELSFTGYTEDRDALRSYSNKDEYILCCGQDKEEVLDNIFKNEDLNGGLDDDLIKYLNFPAAEYFEKRNVYIWGTGVECERFEEWMSRVSISLKILGYIDRDDNKSGKFRYGKRIYSPEMICKKQSEKGTIIVATNGTNYLSIKKDIADRGIEIFDVVSSYMIMDDVRSDFLKLYKSEWYYDTKCKNLDKNIRLRRNGVVSSCCLAFGSNYGNFYYDSFDTIWNSRRAIINRLSLVSHSYVFCDHNRCPFLLGVRPRKYDYEKDTFDCEITRDYPESIAPEIDWTCNLRCISCRNQIIIDESEERDKYSELVLEKIVHLPTRIIINTQGEPLASINSRRIINDERMINNGKFGLYTNGSLLTRDLLDDLSNRYKDLYIAISVDAAMEGTYLQIRRGGNYKKLIKNIEYLSKLRRENKVSFLQFNYVVQSLNISEMEQFVKMCESFNADYVCMWGIENWGIFTDEEYEKINILRGDEIKEEYKSFFTDCLINNPIVNFNGLSRYIGIEAKKMMMI